MQLKSWFKKLTSAQIVNKPTKINILQAAKDGNVDQIIGAIFYGTNLEIKKWGYTPLMKAVLKDHTDIAQTLINNGAEMNTTNNKGETALMNAALFGDIDSVCILLNKGADLDLQAQSTFGTGGYTALHYAICGTDADLALLAVLQGKPEGKPIEVINALIDAHANINCADQQGFTPLIAAVLMGSFEIVRILIENDADINRTDAYNKTALSYAQTHGYGAVAQYIQQAQQQENVN